MQLVYDDNNSLFMQLDTPYSLLSLRPHVFYCFSDAFSERDGSANTHDYTPVLRATSWRERCGACAAHYILKSD